MEVSDHRNTERKSPQKRFLFVLGLAFFAFYLVLGLFLIFKSDLPISMSPAMRISFGVLLIVYAFFRFVRLLKDNSVRG